MTDPLLIETAARAFAATSTFDAVQAAERDGWAPDVWNAAAAIGLPWISVPEEAGGAGGSISDAVAVLGVAGRHAVPLPLAETGLMAGWLLTQAGLAISDGPTTVVPPTAGTSLQLRGGLLYGVAHRVPWGRSSDRVVALLDGHVVVVQSGKGSLEPGSNLAGEPRDTLRFDGTPVLEAAVAPTGVDPDALRVRGCLGRVALMAGALLAVADRTIAFANQRKQFGRPIASFQAVQALLVTCVEEAALVDLAAQVAARVADRGPATFEVLAAKALANSAAGNVGRAAHQVHGAMGMTQEYPLHQLTRRLWSWRAEYGDSLVTNRLGAAVKAHRADDLYGVIAGGSASGILV